MSANQRKTLKRKRRQQPVAPREIKLKLKLWKKKQKKTQMKLLCVQPPTPREWTTISKRYRQRLLHQVMARADHYLISPWDHASHTHWSPKFNPPAPPRRHTHSHKEKKWNGADQLFANLTDSHSAKHFFINPVYHYKFPLLPRICCNHHIMQALWMQKSQYAQRTLD